MSRNLAGPIENISTRFQQQAESATSVARMMQDILRVTEQTTAGTQRTAEAVTNSPAWHTNSGLGGRLLVD